MNATKKRVRPTGIATNNPAIATHKRTRAHQNRLESNWSLLMNTRRPAMRQTDKGKANVYVVHPPK